MENDDKMSARSLPVLRNGNRGIYHPELTLHCTLHTLFKHVFRIVEKFDYIMRQKTTTHVCAHRVV